MKFLSAAHRAGRRRRCHRRRRNSHARSAGLGELSRLWTSETPLCVLDLGSTSSVDIRFFTEGNQNLQRGLLVASTTLGSHERRTGKCRARQPTVSRRQPGVSCGAFDVVLCWNLPDYLDESLVRRSWTPVVCTQAGRDAAGVLPYERCRPDSPCYPSNIIAKIRWKLQRIMLKREARRGPTGAVHTAITEGFRLQRVFNNRTSKPSSAISPHQILPCPDNVREVLVVR